MTTKQLERAIVDRRARLRRAQQNADRARDERQYQLARQDAIRLESEIAHLLRELEVKRNGR